MGEKRNPDTRMTRSEERAMPMLAAVRAVAYRREQAERWRMEQEMAAQAEQAAQAAQAENEFHETSEEDGR